MIFTMSIIRVCKMILLWNISDHSLYLTTKIPFFDQFSGSGGRSASDTSWVEMLKHGIMYVNVM